MRKALLLVLGALLALTGCKNVKIQPSEDFFAGTQLQLAQAIKRGDLNEVNALIPQTDLNTPGTLTFDPIEVGKHKRTLSAKAHHCTHVAG